jgi:phage terminase large subunit-like protein
MVARTIKRPTQSTTTTAPPRLTNSERAMRFVETLRQSKGEWAGRSLELLPWQREVMSKMFDTVNDDGKRQYRTSYIEVPRKNGKSSWAAAIALYMLVADGEQGAEVYLAAVDRDQASIVFSIAADMVRQHPFLSSRLEVLPSTKRITYTQTSSVLRVIASDAAGNHGHNASCVIADEVHAWPSRELWDVLATSTGARRQPLMIAITTAGWDENSLAGQLRDYSDRILAGIVDDKTFLPVIYSAAREDDWTDPKVWAAANPSLGQTISIDYLQAECARAKSIPAYEATFRRLHLCQWTSNESRWLPLDAWDACAGDVSHNEYETTLRGSVAYGGLDLSATTDLTAFVLVIPIDGTYYIHAKLWMPEANLKRKMDADRVPYDVWARQGLITLVPGATIDYAYVRSEINRLGSVFDIRGISYDRWAATQLTQELAQDGFEMTPMSQGMSSMAAPTRELLSLCLASKLRHGNHPVLRWQADNMTVIEDASGNVRPSKGKARQRIDAIVALVMGIDRASRDVSNAASIYEDRGVLVL